MSQSFLVNSDALDLDVLAGPQLPMQDNRCAMLADVNRIPFLRKPFPLFIHARDAHGQIQSHSFVAAFVFALLEVWGKAKCSGRLVGLTAAIVRHTAPPLTEESKGPTSILERNTDSHFHLQREPGPRASPYSLKS
jgi:hypothetical protein